ncbi:hypothetical protein L207DRAFT_416789, partial [Hyaloscypha variabilis F]
RFLVFRYKPGTTAQQKRTMLENFIKLYDANKDLFSHGRKGGMKNSTEGFDKGFGGSLFCLIFEEKEHRDQFVTNAEHIKYKFCTIYLSMSAIDLVEDVIVYDLCYGVYGY